MMEVNLNKAQCVSVDVCTYVCVCVKIANESR
jgi:hypothetical protein